MNDITPAHWLSAIRRYLLFIAAANLVWEFAQLPLYTIWREGTAEEIVFAAVHCTGGDVLIAMSALIGSLIVTGGHAWPVARYRLVAALTVATGLAYTIFSEWLNTEIRGAWAYADIMPVVPIIDSGLSPLAQWIVIPLVGFWWARRPLTVS